MTCIAGDILKLLKTEPYNYQKTQLPEWFNSSSAHDIEMLAVPEFFGNGPLTPNDYITCRNTIIESYRANADYYLTVTSCKSKLPNLDLVSLVKIHNFLETNKLINTIVSFKQYFDNVADEFYFRTIHVEGYLIHTLKVALRLKFFLNPKETLRILVRPICST